MIFECPLTSHVIQLHVSRSSFSTQMEHFLQICVRIGNGDGLSLVTVASSSEFCRVPLTDTSLPEIHSLLFEARSAVSRSTVAPLFASSRSSTVTHCSSTVLKVFLVRMEVIETTATSKIHRRVEMPAIFVPLLLIGWIQNVP